MGGAVAPWEGCGDDDVREAEDHLAGGWWQVDTASWHHGLIVHTAMSFREACDIARLYRPR